MRLNHSTEQALFVVLMLALQKGRTPVKSSVLAGVLQVSDSYLKKVLKQMVDAGLVLATAGREGGYRLAKPVDRLTYGQIIRALEPLEAPRDLETLARSVYSPSQHREETLALLSEAHRQAEKAYFGQLDKIRLTDLMEDYALADGALDWAQIWQQRSASSKD